MCRSPVLDARRFDDRRQAGFTLLELLIVVAVIGILAGVAYPHYRDVMREARVSDGQAALMSLSGHLERCRTQDHSYAGCVDTPTHSEAGHYRITAHLSPSDYRLTATHGGEAVEVTCRVLTIDATGRMLPAACW